MRNKYNIIYDLIALSKKPLSGAKISEITNISWTLYYYLNKLENEGLIKSKWIENTPYPIKRVYYTEDKN